MSVTNSVLKLMLLGFLSVCLLLLLLLLLLIGSEPSSHSTIHTLFNLGIIEPIKGDSSIGKINLKKEN